MFHTIVVSCRSLVWAVLMLALIMYIFNLAFVHAATVYLAGDTLDDDTVEALNLHWSSVLQAMKTLFLAITGGFMVPTQFLSCAKLREPSPRPQASAIDVSSDSDK